VENRVISLLAIFLIATVFLAGCTSQSGYKTGNQTDESIHKLVDSDSGNYKGADRDSIAVESTKNPSSSRVDTGDTYYNIRIVPVSVLEKLQKELGPDEFLVQNDKGNVIGVISSEGLVLRGDLVQLERELGSSGHDFDKTDVALHLLDITFGLDNAKINLFNSNKDYKFWLDAYYSNTEVKYVKDLAKLLNSLSGTTQFEDEEVALGFLQTNYADVPYNFYNIKIVTDKMLKQFFDDRKESDHIIKDSDGTLIGIVNTDYLYLLNTLSEEDREYYILRGILYSMGLHGTSYKNRESFFYREEGVNKNLSDLDMEAIKFLYGGGLKSGNSMEEVKKTLGLST
jgi:hypothetical protein